MHKQKLILHRGYKGKYPESSLVSFENALREGFDFETDIRVSKDGVCFMIHDESMDRLFTGVGKISDFYSYDLKRFRYEQNLSLPLCSLNELCELVDKIENKESLIFIHIKELGDIDKVVEVLNRHGFQDRVRFFAVDELTMGLVDLVKQRWPQYKVGLHFYEDCPYFNEQCFRKSDFVWADEITKKNITREVVELAHGLGKPIYVISPELIPENVFNSNIQGRWKEFLEMNVDGVCTDLPGEFLLFNQ